MTAVAEDDQTRARNSIAQTDAIAERDVRIGFTPNNHVGMRIVFASRWTRSARQRRIDRIIARWTFAVASR